MKIKDLKLTNFAKYGQVSVSFDDNITYLVGKNGSGKSTLGITAIWFMFQGIAEKSSGGNTPLIGERFRFIGNNGATAKGEMTLLDEQRGIEIKVLRKLTKNGTDLSFEAPDGMELDQRWLTDLFNIFLIAPKKFQELSPKQQAQEIGIDTSVFDAAIADLKKKYTEINAVYRSYGDIPVVAEAHQVDITALQSRKQTLLYERQEGRKAIADVLNKKYLDNKAANAESRAKWEAEKKRINDEVDKFNEREAEKRRAYNACTDAYSILKFHGFDGREVEIWLNEKANNMQHDKIAADLYPDEPTYIEELPSNTELLEYEAETTRLSMEIDIEIQQANITNQNAILYRQYLDKVAAKELKSKELADNVEQQKAKEAERLGYIKKFDLPFGNMSIGEGGELLLSGKPIKEPYFSTGELLKIIPILISTRNPEFKYVFLQDFNLLDEDKQEEITNYLIDKGFQLVIEYIGKSTMPEKNCILLKDNIVVDSYEEQAKAALEV